MWESMMGKSIMRSAPALPRILKAALASCPDDPSQCLHRQVFQSLANAFKRRGFGGFDALKTLQRRRYAGPWNDHNAVAIADHHIARGDRNAAADDRQADRSGTAPLRRIRSDAHRID